MTSDKVIALIRALIKEPQYGQPIVIPLSQREPDLYCRVVEDNDRTLKVAPDIESPDCEIIPVWDLESIWVPTPDRNDQYNARLLVFERHGRLWGGTVKFGYTDRSMGIISNCVQLQDLEEVV